MTMFKGGWKWNFTVERNKGQRGFGVKSLISSKIKLFYLR